MSRRAQALRGMKGFTIVAIFAFASVSGAIRVSLVNGDQTGVLRSLDSEKEDATTPNGDRKAYIEDASYDNNLDIIDDLMDKLTDHDEIVDDLVLRGLKSVGGQDAKTAEESDTEDAEIRKAFERAGKTLAVLTDAADQVVDGISTEISNKTTSSPMTTEDGSETTALDSETKIASLESELEAVTAELAKATAATEETKDADEEEQEESDIAEEKVVNVKVLVNGRRVSHSVKVSSSAPASAPAPGPAPALAPAAKKEERFSAETMGQGKA